MISIERLKMSKPDVEMSLHPSLHPHSPMENERVYLLCVVDSIGIASVSLFMVFQETLASFNQPFMTCHLLSHLLIHFSNLIANNYNIDPNHTVP